MKSTSKNPRQGPNFDLKQAAMFEQVKQVMENMC